MANVPIWPHQGLGGERVIITKVNIPLGDRLITPTLLKPWADEQI